MKVSEKAHSQSPTIRDIKGFTIIELLIVVSIIGILATIAIPMFLGQRTKAMRTEAMTNLESIRMLEEQYYAEEGEYTPDLGVCSSGNPGNVALIKAELPAFKPGIAEDLYFSYCIEKDLDYDGNITSAGADPYYCFRARAFGKANTAIEGQVLMIDCNNQKNY